MRKVGENGRAQAIMMYGNDVDILDEYLVKAGLLDETLYQQVGTEHWLRPVLVKARKDALHKIFQEFFKKEQLPVTDEKPEPEQPAAEDVSHAFYVLEVVTPEILGSGSTSQEIARTNNLEEALEIYHSHRANHLVRYSRVNGRLTSKIWDDLECDFV